MRWIAFLSRVAFICNLLFLLSALLQWRSFISDPGLLSTIVVSGYFMAVFLFNPLVNLLYLITLLQKKPLAESVPRWLAGANFIFLVVQILFVLFFLNDTFYY